MKKIIQSLCIFILFSGTFELLAADISSKQAAVVARNFYYERVNQYRDISWKDIKANLIYTEKEKGIPYYYTFAINTGGFVIVSAIHSVVPVLGYSFENPATTINVPENFKTWMEHYKNEIFDAEQQKVAVSQQITNDWNRLMKNDPSELKPAKDVQSVTPMLTAMWNQDQFYNDSCPADASAPAGYNGHVPTGCVATAMGMIMYYYRWPHTGTGAYTYTHPTYGQISANFANSTYYWDQMTNSLSASKPTVAQLLFHEGVSVDMDYEPAGSGMWNHKAAYSMRTYFKYLPQTQYLFKDSTTLNWDSAILVHLDRKQILYYAGWAAVGSTDGHAFICDGYQTTQYFHFNWGWAGMYNGYFYLNSLNPGGSNFNFAQELILNAYPDTLHYTYPEYCSGQQVTHNLEGTIEDGSGPVQNYLPNSSCSWLIDPQVNPQDSVKSIQIVFNRFETEQGQDTLTVYDGPTTSSAVLGSFSGSNLPSSLMSSGNKVLITFITNGSINNNGWLLTYRSIIPQYCNNAVFTTPTGTVSDGSGSKNYQNNTQCNWTIQPANAAATTLTFTEFNTEAVNDYLEVYDLNLGSLLGKYSGNQLPPVLTATSGAFYLTFKTNANTTGPGWSANYSVTNLGVDEIKSGVSFQLFPNPVQDYASLQLYTKERLTAKLIVCDMPGRIIIQKDLHFSAGYNVEQIDLRSFSKGSYIMRLVGDKTAVSKILLKE